MKGLIPQLLEDIADFKKENTICQVIKNTQNYQKENMLASLNMRREKEYQDNQYTNKSSEATSKFIRLEKYF